MAMTQPEPATDAALTSARPSARDAVTVAIGEFARLTHLSVKSLRHYHDLSLLVPADVDPFTGYRRYRTDQVVGAQLIRRLRLIDMPLATIGEVLNAPDESARDLAISRHLERMEAGLASTQAAVRSLRELMGPTPVGPIEYRAQPDQPALAVRARVARADISQWCGAVFPRLYARLDASGVDPSGPAGASYSSDFFTGDAGDVVAFVPVLQWPGVHTAGPDSVDVAGPDSVDVEALTMPGGRFAVGVHAGPFSDLDRTYAALGSRVAQDGVSAHGPIREIYLVGPTHTDNEADFRTEVGWPASSTRSV